MAGMGIMTIGGGGYSAPVGTFGDLELLANAPRMNTAATAPVAVAPTPTLNANTLSPSPTSSVGTTDNVPRTRVSIGANGELNFGATAGGGVAQPTAGAQASAPRASAPVSDAQAMISNPIVEWAYTVVNAENIDTVILNAGSSMAEVKALNPHMKPGETVVIPMHSSAVQGGGAAPAAAIPDHVTQFVAEHGGTIAGAGGGATQQSAPAAVAPAAAAAAPTAAAPAGGGLAPATATAKPDLASLTKLLETLTAYRQNATP